MFVTRDKDLVIKRYATAKAILFQTEKSREPCLVSPNIQIDFSHSLQTLGHFRLLVANHAPNLDHVMLFDPDTGSDDLYSWEVLDDLLATFLVFL